MATFPRRFLVVGLILLTGGYAAFGGNYADPSGFSLSYPDDWVLVTRAAMGDLNQAVPREMKDWILRNNVDLNRIVVILIRNGREEFLENLNVIVEGQQISVDDQTVKRMAEMFAQKLKATGVTVDNFQCGVQKVGSRDAVVVEQQIRMPGVPYTLRQKQVMFPGGGKTYIVTCTAKVDTFDLYKPTFEQILASFQVPDPIAHRFDWNPILRMGVVGGVVGGLIGGLTWLMRKFSRKSGPKPEGGRTTDSGELGAV